MGDGNPDNGGVEQADLDDLDPADPAPEDVADLSTEQLLELTGGGVVDADGNATPFGDGPAGPAGPSAGSFDAGPETADPAPTAEETAEQLADRLEEVSDADDPGPHRERFPDDWMAAHTEFATIDAFLAAGPWQEGADVWDVPVEELDDHAAAHSEFESWQAMAQAAGEQWLADELDFLQE